MCWSCPCGQLDADHDDPRNITTLTLKGAAATPQAATDVAGVIANMSRALEIYKGLSPDMRKGEEGMSVALKALSFEKERQYTLGLAYPANRADRAVAADGYRDFAPHDVLEDAAWNYIRKGARVGLMHAKGTDGRGAVVESYIYRGPDWEITTPSGEKTMIKAGDWLLGIIWDDYSWRAIKSGKVTGLSPQAKVRRRIPSPEALAGLRSD